MERPIVYEPHPVSRERKAELLAEGFRIVDAKYRPSEAEDVLPPDLIASMPPADDLSKLTVEKLKEMLDAAGVEYPADAKKADLSALLEAANA